MATERRLEGADSGVAVKRQAKNAALAALRATGAFSMVLNSARRTDRLLILCYHGIGMRDESQWSPYLYVTADHFRQRMQLIRDYGICVLPFGEGLQRLRKGTLPPRSAVVTFDDGFVDFQEVAAPVLEQFGFPCTLYLTTHYCRYPVPVFNLVLDYILWKSGLKAVEMANWGHEGLVPIATMDERLAALRRTVQWCAGNGFDTMRKDQLARDVATKLGIDYDALVRSRMFQVMTPNEVAVVAAKGVDIQLHTHRHRTPGDRELFVREIRENRDHISAMTGRQPVHFCYPSGRYELRFLPWLREEGVLSATTCDPGLAAAASEPLLLPRILDDSTVSQLDFESWMCGIRI